MRFIAALVLFLSLTSCGTLFSKGGGDIMVTSKPSGAEIQLDGKEVGVTPAQVHLKQNAKGKITVSLSGYVPQTRKVGTSIQPATFLNLFWGYLALPFFLVDAASGNVTNWDESGIYFKLAADEISQ